MASIVQNPGIPTKIAPLLTGEEGNGKNFFFDMFAAILGPQNHTVTSYTRIFSRFNGSIEGKSLVFVNEMGQLEKKEWGALREMITDPTAMIERKGQEIRTVQNVANFVFVSNVLHLPLFPDLGTTKRRIVHLSCRNVFKDPHMWDKFWEWSGEKKTTRKICNASLALADFLYNRKVKNRVDKIPVDENGISSGLSGLQDVPQWWHDCLVSGLILGSTNQTPWDTNRTAFSGPSKVKWISLKEPFRVLRQEMFEAFINWVKASMGIRHYVQSQFSHQMNDLLLGRTPIVPRNNTRTTKKNGQKPYWMIEPLLDERRKFCLLYENYSFDGVDDMLTDGGTLPIDKLGTDRTDDYKSLTEGLPELWGEGIQNGKAKDDDTVVMKDMDEDTQMRDELDVTNSSRDEDEEEEDDEDEQVDMSDGGGDGGGSSGDDD